MANLVRIGEPTDDGMRETARGRTKQREKGKENMAMSPCNRFPGRAPVGSL